MVPKQQKLSHGSSDKGILFMLAICMITFHYLNREYYSLNMSSQTNTSSTVHVFPNTLNVIHCTHIGTKSPSNIEDAYAKRKLFYTKLNNQAASNDNLNLWSLLRHHKTWQTLFCFGA